MLDNRRNADYVKEIIVSLTPRGRELFDRHEAYHRTLDTMVGVRRGGLAEEDLGRIKAMIGKMLDAIAITDEFTSSSSHTPGTRVPVSMGRVV